MEPIVGIDLGTTNSEIAILREDNQPEVLEENGTAILPSAVGVGREGELLIGEPARNQAVLAPDRTVLSVKRRMGEETKIPLGEEAYTPQEISAMVLRKLRERAERALGQRVTKAVITVPAYFKDAQRQATREAGELAGLEVARIVNEPTAAALTYDPNPAQRERLLVYDLGGGTFDVSIVQIEEGVVEVLASQGNTQLGGDDMDRALFDEVCDRFQSSHGLDLRDDPTARSRVLQAVEQAKKTLSFEPLARAQAEFVARQDDTPLHLDEEIDRDSYEQRIQPLIDETLACVDRALSDAGLRADELDRVILVGGATRTPRVRQVLEEKLGKTPHGEVEPDLCVGLGAAVQGGLVAGLDVGPVLVDITPHTLGLEVAGEIGEAFSLHSFSPIIPRNTPLPASRTEMYSTMVDEQQVARICVRQGENDDARNNTLLGEFYLEDLAERPAGSRIPVRFDLDLDGVLTVTATEHATGHSSQLTIESAMERFRQTDRADAHRRIGAAFGEPEPTGDREASEGSVTQGPFADAQALIEKGERLLSSVADEDAEDLQSALTAMREAVQAGDEERLRKVRPELEDLVFYLEDA